jgi:hypothetical protein
MAARKITTMALLVALIVVTGALKVPGLIPGTEFQLSAPIAVAICVAFGFRQYFMAGILASTVSLLLGTQTLFTTAIAMIFRLTVGAVFAIFGDSYPVILLVGPVGSFLARLSLAGLLGQGVWAVIAVAVPGMIYTACSAWPLTLLLRKVRRQTESVSPYAVQR